MGFSSLNIQSGAVTALGEILISLEPEGYYRFLQANTVQMNFVGTELNALSSLSRFGMDTRMVTCVPDHEIGDCVIASVRKYGVDSRFIVRGGDRMGIMYLEKGASQRPDLVVYDRRHTSIAEADAAAFDLDGALNGAAWFHTSGITPALSENSRALTLAALKLAKEKGLTVSFDMNFRSKLWSEAEAKPVLEALMPYVDVLIATEWDVKQLLGLSVSIENGITDDTFVQAAALVKERFGVKVLTATRREVRTASDHNLRGLICADGQLYASRSYDMHLVNRIGGGDAFTAGVIYGITHGYDPQRTAELAAAAACLKHSIEGDINLCSLAEVERLAAEGGPGRIRR